MKTPIQLVYLNDDDSDVNYLAVDTSGVSKEELTKKYGVKVRDVITISADVTERFDAWPTDRLLSDS